MNNELRERTIVRSKVFCDECGDCDDFIKKIQGVRCTNCNCPKESHCITEEIINIEESQENKMKEQQVEELNIETEKEVEKIRKKEIHKVQMWKFHLLRGVILIVLFFTFHYIFNVIVGYLTYEEGVELKTREDVIKAVRKQHPDLCPAGGMCNF